MNTCSFTIPFNKISACSKVFVECILYLGELKEAFSSLQLTPLPPEVSPTTKKLRKLKRACIESFQHSDTLGSQNPRSSSGTNFIK
jgi:hypothetical protein